MELSKVLSGIFWLIAHVRCFTLTLGVTVARSVILSRLSAIKEGMLVVSDERGQRHVFGEPINLDDRTLEEPRKPKANGSALVKWRRREITSIPLRAELEVKSGTFWLRLFFFADMGFAESYMLGEVECSDLTAFFRLFILNRNHLGNGVTFFSMIFGKVSSLTRSTNTPSNSLLNASRHYDLSNDMFAAFLSRDMTYSCPIWAPVGRGGRAESLEEAQMTKLHRFIDGAKIKSTDHVLEIGTGWGSFAIEAVRKTGCRVTTLTLSKKQKSWVEKRIAAEGLSERIKVRLMDYRELPIPEEPYDKIVSIEMIEAVGKEFLGTYFSRINELLKRNGGIAMFQCITMPESRYEAYAKSEEFINRYIFPGGHLPSITLLLNHITTESHGTLIVEKVENIGGHYARTLRLWRERFLAKFDRKIRPALMRQRPDWTEENADVFRRMWEYYFTYCEAGFLTKTLGDVIITVGREGATELMEGIPL
ncbi:Mycolic acid cyclopropane synthetase-domain-containing protein [Achaetomium macrosporum]|uniref:Mycolic acid cyclopropane synthetase-domain-containing protein n=1 Tax=Achaetomium macrosporum TaxID=79813 RepID=A0AAN7CE50_9PEZI|nr:Mycolic acid cyclopropane synthetase-domain-containing protein [Achaetomium macrosporum]